MLPVSITMASDVLDPLAEGELDVLPDSLDTAVDVGSEPPAVLVSSAHAVSATATVMAAALAAAPR